jgi:peptide/nickel transport system substrate-binding protein
VAAAQAGTAFTLERVGAPMARRAPALALVLVGLFLLAGCTSNTQRRGGTGTAAKQVTIGTTDTITSLDPGNAYEFLPTNVLWNTEGTLLTYKLDSAGSQPELATGFPDVSSDGLTYTFHLRSGLKYNDGTPLQAHDFLWALDRNSGKVGGQEGGPAFLIYDSAGIDVANSSAPDPTTLILRLKQPAVYLDAIVVFANFAPLPQGRYTKNAWVEPTGGAANLPISSGPYYISDYRPNELIHLTKNPFYTGPRVAKASDVVIKLYSSSASLKAAVENGEVDVAYRTFTAGDWGDLTQRAGGTFRTLEVPGPSPERFLAIQVQKPPFDDKDLRQALALLVDRDEVARVAYQGTVTPAYSIIPDGLGFAGQKDSFREKYGAGPNLEQAKQILQAKGYSASNKLTFDLWFNSDGHYGDEEPDLASVLKAQFEKTGLITVNLPSKQWVAYKADFRQGLLPVFLIGWFPDYLDPDDYVSPFLTEGGARSFGTFYHSSAADDLIRAEQTERGAQARAQDLQNVQDLAADDVPMIPLFTGKEQATARTGLQGVQLPPHQLLPYFTIEG